MRRRHVKCVRPAHHVLNAQRDRRRQESLIDGQEHKMGIGEQPLLNLGGSAGTACTPRQRTGAFYDNKGGAGNRQTTLCHDGQKAGACFVKPIVRVEGSNPNIGVNRDHSYVGSSRLRSAANISVAVGPGGASDKLSWPNRSHSASHSSAEGDKVARDADITHC
jgi:hypothetical protein